MLVLSLIWVSGRVWHRLLSTVRVPHFLRRWEFFLTCATLASPTGLIFVFFPVEWSLIVVMWASVTAVTCLFWAALLDWSSMVNPRWSSWAHKTFSPLPCSFFLFIALLWIRHLLFISHILLFLLLSFTHSHLCISLGGLLRPSFSDWSLHFSLSLVWKRSNITLIFSLFALFFL